MHTVISRPGPRGSKVWIDDPPSNGGYGDTQSLKVAKIPMATVFKGKVGRHEIDNGRLQFTYKAGALTKDQVQKIQINLDSEQKFFDLP